MMVDTIFISALTHIYGKNAGLPCQKMIIQHHLISPLQDYGLSSSYCVDSSLDSSGRVVEIALKCEAGLEETWAPGLATCLDKYTTVLRRVNSISGGISCFFLAVTFLVYVSVPELDNLHGKIVLSNVATIFLVTSYLLLVYNLSPLPPAICR